MKKSAPQEVKGPLNMMEVTVPALRQLFTLLSTFFNVSFMYSTFRVKPFFSADTYKCGAVFVLRHLTSLQNTRAQQDRRKSSYDSIVLCTHSGELKQLKLHLSFEFCD